jgi:hypothetical protein
LGLEYLSWHSFGLYWIILLVVIFGKVHFSAVIMLIFLKLPEPNFFENIFGISYWLLFAEPCLLAVHSVKFVKGQRKMWQLQEPI